MKGWSWDWLNVSLGAQGPHRAHVGHCFIRGYVEVL